MYQLHIANKAYSSWSLRPWVMMRQAGIAFEERFHAFNEAGSSYEAFISFSPTGRVPCLEDGDTVVWDSLAILEYLAERHDGLWPDEPQARAWARCASAEMHSAFSALRNERPMLIGVSIKPHNVSKALQADLDRIDALWNEGLTCFGGPFLAGERFTCVDAMFAPVAYRIEAFGISLSDAALAYAERLRALPSMRDWAEAAVKEVEREIPVEDELPTIGVVTKDWRAVRA